MKKERVMPLGLVKYTILKKFKKLNPDAEPDDLDWDCLDYPTSFNECYREMARAHPEYVWFEESLEEIERKEKDIEIQNLIESGEEEEKIDRIREEQEMQTIKGGWKVGRIAGKLTYTKTVKIKPHLKGKYMRGRIQTTCDSEFIELEAKITFVKLEEPYKDSTELELNEYE